MGADGEPSRRLSPWCAPLLMAYYLCCWPGDSKSDTSSENNQSCRESSRRSTVKHDSGSRRSSHVFGHRLGSSAISLHLPSTSGSRREPPPAHRSHEEIARRRSAHAPRQDARYHSAPSVIHEVLHRRDWDRSARELHIPLRPETLDTRSISSDSLEPTPVNELKPEESKTNEQIVLRACKKHYTNIKSSKGKKEKQVEEYKDCDATEVSSFYIGDNDANANLNSPKRDDVLNKSIYKAKEAKQSFNESIRSKDRPKQKLVPLEENQPRMFEFCLDDVIDQLSESLDRSGAEHHSIESRVSLSKPVYPPPSVEPCGYEGGACYLEGGRAAGLRAVGGLRARHASDGDILAPPQRPESGAFSESDLDLELEAAQEPPPAYDELAYCASPKRKETAI